MRSTKHHKIDNKDAELKNLRKLIKKVGSHRVDGKDTTLMVREMREKQYDVYFNFYDTLSKPAPQYLFSHLVF